jgi:hypothetical protein
VLLTGVPVDDRLVLQIAGLVGHPLGTKLVTAYRLRWPVVALTFAERDEILTALDAAPAAFRDLRETLLAHEAWQTRQRLR